jgi:uncharacterized membrane protein YsdA (DUF1294 family)
MKTGDFRQSPRHVTSCRPGLGAHHPAARLRATSQVPSILLLLALAGGSPGAFTGRALFGHKTRKQPFVTRLYGVVVLQVSATAFWLFLKYGPRLQA